MNRQEIQDFKRFLETRGVFSTFMYYLRQYSGYCNSKSYTDFNEYCKSRLSPKDAIMSAFPFEKTTGVFNSAYWLKAAKEWEEVCSRALAISNVISDDSDEVDWFEGLDIIRSGKTDNTRLAPENERNTLYFSYGKRNTIKFSSDISDAIKRYGFNYLTPALDSQHNKELIFILSVNPTSEAHSIKERSKNTILLEYKPFLQIVAKYVGCTPEYLDCKKLFVGSIKYNKDKSKMALVLSKKLESFI